MSAGIEVGSKVRVDGKTLTVAWVGKEVKLEGAKGEVVWRHSRTIARLLEEQTTAKAKPARKRGSKTARKLEATLAAADAAREEETPTQQLVEA